MAMVKQRVYVRGSYLPFEEDETHEFKGHREMAPEDTPPWAFRNPRETQTRQAISRNLNAFLNSVRGGVVYCGVDDRGRVLGLHLTRYQKDHVLVSVRCLLLRYQPAVPSCRHRVTFVPVVSRADVDNSPTEFAYDASRRSKQHLVATSHYCWCDADARARSVSGVIPLSYVIEIEILPWADRDKALHPFYLTESGKCYVRRQASVMPLNAADCIRITRHEAAALSQRQSEQVALESQRDIAALEARLSSGLLRPAGLSACRCPSGPDTPQLPAGARAGGAVRLDRGTEGGESREDWAESRAAAAAAGVEAPARVVLTPGSGHGGELAQSCSGDNGLAQSSSTDGGLAHAQSSSTGTELAHSSGKLFHSSSSDSGLSLSSSYDTEPTKKSSFDFINKGSSSSESGIASHSDSRVSVTPESAPIGPVASELPGPPTFASGVQAVSELLEEVLSSGIPPRPTQQSPLNSTATTMAPPAGGTVSDSELHWLGGMLPGAGLGGSLSDVRLTGTGAVQGVSVLDLGGSLSDVPLSGTDAARGVSVLDLAESGSEASLAPERSAPERSVVDLGTSGTDISISEAALGENDLCIIESNMDTRETDLDENEVDLGAKDTHQGAIGTSLVASKADVLAREVAGLCASGSDLGISGADASLLELESVAESPPSRLGTSSSLDALRISTSTPSSFLVTPGSAPALTTESESESESHHASAREEPLSPAAQSTPSIRGRGKAFEAAGKIPETSGKTPDSVEEALDGAREAPESFGKVLAGSGTCGALRIGSGPPGQCELDSDDSEDSWDAAEFRPGRRLVASLSDSAGLAPR